MIFHYPQRKIENLIPNLKFNSKTIERVSELNFLCLISDECLSWKPHVQKVSDKVSRTLVLYDVLKTSSLLMYFVHCTITYYFLTFTTQSLCWVSKWAGLKDYKNGLYE